MLVRQRRRHHALADRLEDLRLAEFGNQQAERQRPPGACGVLHERARSGAALDETVALQIANGAADRDPRRAERAHELGLARQPVAALEPSAQDVAP